MSVQAIAGVSPTFECADYDGIPVGGCQWYRSSDRPDHGQYSDPHFWCKTVVSSVRTAAGTAGDVVISAEQAIRLTLHLTNRSVQVWSSLGTQRTAMVDLNDIADVELDQRPGQAFFRASDIRLKAANGQTILRLAGVCDAGAFRNAIQRTIQSRRLVQSSLATIAARK